MWTIFKILNLWWLLSSTYAWPMLGIPALLLLFVANVGMIISISFQPIKLKIDAKSGWVILAILGLILWSTWVDGWGRGITTALQYIPVLYLMQLPYEYLKDLLKFVTKWYAILLIPALILYWLLLFVSLPSLGTFIYTDYPPFLNYIFYIKTTFDSGFLVRFNAFFLEPGHQAIVSTFLLMANRFDFRKFPLLIVLALGVVFSFSLAGYILCAVALIFLKVNNLPRFLTASAIIAIIIGGAYFWNGGDNSLNELIVKRLEYDKSTGIKGNNRFYNNTDYEFERTIGTKYLFTGIKGRTNMDLISGAGYKIYILNFGLVGTILVIFFYLSVIPSNPDYRYTISFFIIIALCFVQRAYPFWYSWLLPYVVGIYIAKDEKERKLLTECEESGIK